MTNDHYDYQAEQDKEMKEVYSLHFDKFRLAFVLVLVMFVVSATFFIGMFVGESKDRVYRADQKTSSLDKQELDEAFAGQTPSMQDQIQLPNQEELRGGQSLLSKQKEKQLSPIQEMHLEGSGSSKQKGKETSSQVASSSKKKNKPVSANASKKQKDKSEHNRVIGTSHSKTSKPSPQKTSSGDSSKSFVQRIKDKYPIKEGYQIQVASFKKVAHARKAKKGLAQKGFEGIISAKVTKKGINYRVSVGPGLSMAKLDKRLVQIRRKTNYQNAFIIKM
jgi:cell division septation protein DedD